MLHLFSIYSNSLFPLTKTLELVRGRLSEGLGLGGVFGLSEGLGLGGVFGLSEVLGIYLGLLRVAFGNYLIPLLN